MPFRIGQIQQQVCPYQTLRHDGAVGAYLRVRPFDIRLGAFPKKGSLSISVEYNGRVHFNQSRLSKINFALQEKQNKFCTPRAKKQIDNDLFFGNAPHSFIGPSLA